MWRKWGTGMTALSLEDHKLVLKAHQSLRRVSANGVPQTVFDALRPCTPIVGGLIGTLTPGTVDAMVTHAVGLPEDVLKGWFDTPREQMLMMLSPLIVASGGELISGTQGIPESMRDQLDLWRVMSQSGLGETAGYMVSDPVRHQRRLTFLTFALDEKAQFTPRDHIMLGLLRHDIHAALERVGLPFIPSQSIMAQVMENRRSGFVLVSQETMRCVEMNMRARELVGKYSESARIERGQYLMFSFAMRAVFETRRQDAWILSHHRGEGEIKVTVHELKKEEHAIGQDLWLVMLDETQYPAEMGMFAQFALTPREEQIAAFLVETSLFTKEIAARLGTSYDTVRTQIGTIYRKCGVNSRKELLVRLKGRLPS